MLRRLGAGRVRDGDLGLLAWSTESAAVTAGGGGVIVRGLEADDDGGGDERGNSAPGSRALGAGRRSGGAHLGRIAERERERGDLGILYFGLLVRVEEGFDEDSCL